MVGRDPFCWHCSSIRGMALKSAVPAAASGHPGCDLGGVMLETAVGAMTQNLCTSLAITDSCFPVGPVLGVFWVSALEHKHTEFSVLNLFTLRIARDSSLFLKPYPN